MKKLSIGLLAIVFALGMAFTAQAQDLVEVKTTTDPIQLFPCEKSGAISFSFDPGTTLSNGDWWIVRLPFGVTLCRTIDVEISNGMGTAILGPGNPAVVAGPVEWDPGSGPGDALGGNSGIYFRVTGQSGSQTVRISVVSVGGAGTGLVITDNSSASPGAIVIKLWDSVPQVGFIWLDSDNDGTYGDDVPADNGTKADNTMCIDARNITGNCVEVSYDSRDDYLTFTGDNVVACRVAGEDIVCTGCKEGFCDISLTTTQSTICDFDYETATGRACTTAATCGGNRIIIQNNTGYFGDQPSDDFALRISITNPTNGVAFAGTLGLQVRVSDSAVVDMTDCTSTGQANVTPATVNAFLSNGTTPVTSFNTGTCSISAAQMATVLVTDTSAGFSGLDVRNQIWADLPSVVFDPTMVSASTNITVQVELIKLPCTTLATCTVDIGHFVDSCFVTVPSSYSFTIPYSTAANDPVWWSGAALSNCMTTDAACTLTFNEMDSDVGTYSVTVPAGGMWVSLWSAILSNITQTGGTGSLGDSAMFVCITCTGGNVKSFFLLGDGTQAQGSAIGTGCP